MDGKTDLTCQISSKRLVASCCCCFMIYSNNTDCRITMIMIIIIINKHSHKNSGVYSCNTDCLVTVYASMESRVVPLRCEQVFTCVDRDLRTSGSDLLRWATVRREDLHFTGKPNSPLGRWTLRRNFSSGPEGHLLQASAAEKAHALNGTPVNYHKIALEVVGIILPTWQGQIQM